MERPRVILSAAMSIDGKIATRTGDSGLSSVSDLRRVHRLRARVDAIIVGRGTVELDDPLLTVRHAGGPDPIRVIISSAGKIPARSQILETARQVRTIVACSGKIPASRRRMLEGRSVRVVVSGRERVELGRLLRKLYSEGVRSILLEGGGKTNWEFVRRGLVDEVIITVVPYLIGGTDSVTLMDGRGFAGVRGSPKFRLERVLRVGDEIVLRYSKMSKYTAR